MGLKKFLILLIILSFFTTLSYAENIHNSTYLKKYVIVPYVENEFNFTRWDTVSGIKIQRKLLEVELLNSSEEKLQFEVKYHVTIVDFNKKEYTGQKKQRVEIKYQDNKISSVAPEKEEWIEDKLQYPKPYYVEIIKIGF